MKVIQIFAFSILLAACSAKDSTKAQVQVGDTPENIKLGVAAGPMLGLKGDTLEPINLTEQEWGSRLSDQEFNVLREEGTERAFTSPLNEIKENGIFVCAACQLPLFSSETKFKSGTGWPSFYQPIRASHVREISDTSFGWQRVEVECARCGGHQGHVFDDGPPPTGLRYCINGVALAFVPQP